MHLRLTPLVAILLLAAGCGDGDGDGAKPSYDAIESAVAKAMERQEDAVYLLNNPRLQMAVKYRLESASATVVKEQPATDAVHRSFIVRLRGSATYVLPPPLPDDFRQKPPGPGATPAEEKAYREAVVQARKRAETQIPEEKRTHRIDFDSKRTVLMRQEPGGWTLVTMANRDAAP